jgi:hypothetical protein
MIIPRVPLPIFVFVSIVGLIDFFLDARLLQQKNVAHKLIDFAKDNAHFYFKDSFLFPQPAEEPWQVLT